MDQHVKQGNDQAIAQLTPLADVLAGLDRLVQPVIAREIGISEANGCVLAADVTGPLRPQRQSALRDGWAVRAEELADASGYAPVALVQMPTQVETGEELPVGTDAVASPDFITVRGNGAEAISAVAPGEGVLPAGGDCDPAKPLRETGLHIRTTDISAFEAAGISRVSVRQPRLRIIAAREDLRLQPALQMIARDCAAQGAEPLMQNGADLDRALQSSDANALVIVGGSGTGERDASVAVLAQVGRVAVHGVGLTPGETAAVGEANERPVLIVPGRFDAALAVWLVIGRHMLALLAGSKREQEGPTYKLTRKVTSTVSLAEFVPVKCIGDSIEPLATAFLPLSALARADGYILVPADSEGFAAGTPVAVKPWPQ